MSENHFNFFKLKPFTRNDALYLGSFAALMLDFWFRAKTITKPSNKSFGNMPIAGGVSAAALLSGIAIRGEGYSHYPVEAGILHSFDDSLFKKLAGYQKMNAAIYNKEYQRVYNILSYSQANSDEWAHKLASRKQEIFQVRGGRCLGTRLIEKNIFTLFEPIAHFYGTFKLYKNMLNMLENFLSLRQGHNAEDAIYGLKTKTNRSDQARVFQARNGLRRAHKLPRSVRVKNSNAENAASRSTLIKPLINDASYVSTIDTSYSHNHGPLKKKKKKIAPLDSLVTQSTLTEPTTQSRPLLFSKKDSRADAKSQTETQLIDKDQEKNKILQKKQEILACYRSCKQNNKNLFRSILDKSAENVALRDVLNLALKLNLKVYKTSLGGYIEIYKKFITSTHRPHDTIADPGFLSSLAANFNAIDITTEDLDRIDDEISLDCSPNGFLSSLNYVLTTRPNHA